MKKYLLWGVIVSVLSSCGSRRDIPAGAPPPIKERTLLKQLAAGENDFNTLGWSGTGNFQDDQTSQSFRVEVRMLRDSLVWIDIADPFLGIKVARAVIYRDSVAFMNRLEKQYYTGPLKKLQQRLNMDFGFRELQAILSANLIFSPDRSYTLYYRPAFYLLADYSPPGSPEETPRVVGPARLHEIYIDPLTLKPVQQYLNEPTMGKKYEVILKDIQLGGDLLFPKKIQVTYTHNTSSSLSLDIRKAEKDPSLNFPFSIPGSYDLLR